MTPGCGGSAGRRRWLRGRHRRPAGSPSTSCKVGNANLAQANRGQAARGSEAEPREDWRTDQVGVGGTSTVTHPQSAEYRAPWVQSTEHRMQHTGASPNRVQSTEHRGFLSLGAEYRVLGVVHSCILKQDSILVVTIGHPGPARRPELQLQTAAAAAEEGWRWQEVQGHPGSRALRARSGEWGQQLYRET